MSKKKSGIHPMLNTYLDGLDASTDGRGFNAKHEKALKFVEGACILASQIARLQTYPNAPDDDDAMQCLNGLIEQARSLR